MARVLKKAKEVQVGDILDAQRGHGVCSVKKVFIAENKALGKDEVTIHGPLNIVDKMWADDNVAVLV